MVDKFRLDAPTGILTIRTLDDLAARSDEILALVSKLEKRIEKLEKALTKQKRTA
jgi:cell division protein ZapA (FtsZ GTPase activity inhibitor)